jgi:hypothetical protein
MALPVGAWAEGFTNQDMVRYCATYLTFSKKPKERSPNAKDGFDTGLCKGLMYGILNGYQLGYQDGKSEKHAQIACIPDSMNSDHVALAYQHWVKTHPEDINNEAYKGLLDAVREVFVCPNPKPVTPTN